mmetsp:Transcript_17650/g.26156  ORF Transcript_17650/g.26156 Transcript_17650/m.26156 type:complete len:94 (+) Transcript_17650:824-1105(+)
MLAFLLHTLVVGRGSWVPSLFSTAPMSTTHSAVLCSNRTRLRGNQYVQLPTSHTALVRLIRTVGFRTRIYVGDDGKPDSVAPLVSDRPCCDWQ